MLEPENRGRLTAGAILILLGIAFLAMNFLGELGQATVIFVVGAIFVAAYFMTKRYGFLIPGCILVGMALGQLGEDSWFSFQGLGSLGLGVGFIAIFLIDTIYRGGSHWWPLIPGGVLVIASLAQANQTFQVLFARGWPLILVLVGLVILAGAFGLSGRRSQ
jgi:hypothetical protein